ncbi:hypothetical protein AVEN_20334-1 [Araneus ventricosus]|uniref:Uncharacterized protein n=1 Tax=Araneus ventricosus TaxID=182803 RepID=A0A4Y2INZ9_ARAVE|nr:hypothetical protein AVEN_20334-1 [Araneus ventricosus]
MGKGHGQWQVDAFSSGPVRLFVRYFRYNAVRRSARHHCPTQLVTRVRAVEIVSLGSFFLGMEGWLEFHPWLPPSQGICYFIAAFMPVCFNPARSLILAFSEGVICASLEVILLFKDLRAWRLDSLSIRC